jgi:chemotaxis protein methyltransferase CheR
MADAIIDSDLKCILDFLHESRNLDFSGYRESMIERRVKNRFPSVKCNDYKDYCHYLKAHPSELDNLIDSLTINVSHFFRNPLTFEYLADIVLPEIIYNKNRHSDASLRIWSAGCAKGEEPYSIAILINEFLKKEKIKFDIRIFATDIDENVMEKAKKAIYPAESVENVKYSILKKYFTPQNDSFSLVSEIKDMVSFSRYNILDKKSQAPPVSIFGGFDMVFCRNVLIYFNADHQELIFEKLYQSLNTDGCLVLGEAEIPVEKYKRDFRKENKCCHIYQKIG